MRTTTFLVAAFLGWSQFVIADEPAGDAQAAAAKAKSCAACHNAMVSLKGRGTDVITGQIKAIRTGDKEHPPGLASLCEEDLKDIAAYLNTAD